MMRTTSLVGVACGCAVVGAALARPLAALSAVGWGGSFDSPVCMTADPLDPSTMYVVEKAGVVRIVKNGVQQAQAFANLGAGGASIVESSGGEQGLLGMAFSPNFASDRRVYFNFTSNGAAPPNPPGAVSPPLGATVIARFTVPVPAGANPASVSLATRFDLSFGYDEGTVGERWIDRALTVHNGGTINFGPDGFLYIGMGDGGDWATSQDPLSLLGKILRIDPGVASADAIGYRIPASNPFLPANLPPALAGFDARPQIWAFGVRNPWKHSFDDYGHGRTGAYIIADVGSGDEEELDFQAPGAGGHNYGWPRFEGSILQQPGVELAYDVSGTSHRYVAPTHTYSHAVGVSISGGYTYRGQAMCSYKGRYFFADFDGRVWSARLTGSGVTDVIEHVALEGSLTVGFGRDRAGELYIIRLSGIDKIVSDDEPLGGDADGDRDVDFADLNTVLSQFGTTGPAGGNGLAGDVNDDGSVSFADLNTVLSYFGQDCL